MKTLILEKPGILRAIDTAPPDEPDSNSALVRVHRVGVCGTDIHAFHGRQPFFTYPRILGHELGVEIVKVGPNERGLKAGDRCAVEPYINCGKCIACRRGKTNCCENLSVLGIHRDGGMREFIVVPTHKLHPSSSLTMDQLALVETLGIGAHAVERAHLHRGETALVIGAGPIGLAVIQFAQVAKVRLIVVDISEERLKFCREKMGVRHTINTTYDLPTVVREMNHGELPTVVFDATGNAKSMNAAFELPAHGGRLVFVGLFQGDVTFNDPNFHKRELSLLATRNALAFDFEKIIALVETGQVDTRSWITHYAKLSEVPAQFESWTRPETGVLKAMIEVV
ncbi:MAG TPA: zinc-binding alcohol dehydrogenase family protein [Verrucomicrobiae bacterium]|jgi:2-desacetyl-2-hydroxyethyl bacteriochlorophyllide A dehydrogenase|nr:zinc-binding alcohol dehydrogenase family protein [Verrucomicrobiae bacterium]